MPFFKDQEDQYDLGARYRTQASAPDPMPDTPDDEDLHAPTETPRRQSLIMQLLIGQFYSLRGLLAFYVVLGLPICALFRRIGLYGQSFMIANGILMVFCLCIWLKGWIARLK